jgi:hypothetical protein
MKYQDIKNEERKKYILGLEVEIRKLGQKCEKPEEHAIEVLEKLNLTSKKWHNLVYFLQMSVDLKRTKLGKEPIYFTPDKIGEEITKRQENHKKKMETIERTRAIAKSLLDF